MKIDIELKCLIRSRIVKELFWQIQGDIRNNDERLQLMVFILDVELSKYRNGILLNQRGEYNGQ